ncbi:hypothetical protein [Acinetobacter sp. ANC 4779]|uniref:hypothetical protein n=1 Tax=Acinetobacter sp. ANC 4779 TaxID=2529848 RepID=UPI001D18CC09|nr:hypothetical protein [Acinetobacter sp. ANC 4779]
MNNSRMNIETLSIGDKVKMATMEHLVFTITAENADGTLSIETQLDQQNVLSYGNISREMLRKIVA